MFPHPIGSCNPPSNSERFQTAIAEDRSTDIPTQYASHRYRPRLSAARRALLGTADPGPYAVQSHPHSPVNPTTSHRPLGCWASMGTFKKGTHGCFLVADLPRSGPAKWCSLPLLPVTRDQMQLATRFRKGNQLNTGGNRAQLAGSSCYHCPTGL